MTARRPTPRVLVMGWDGVHYDELVLASTPSLDRVASQGFLRPVRVDERNPTISGPVWATVATGVHADRHRIRDNRLWGHALADYPDMMTVLHRERPELSTFAAAGWGPLTTKDQGGPVFGGATYRPGLPTGLENAVDGGYDAVETMDRAVTAQTAMELLTGDHALVFSYLVVADMVGHIEGVTPRYRAAIEQCDAQLGVLLAMIDARGTRRNEAWTVIVVTDHGHLDAGGHGGDHVHERTAWIAAAGPGIAPEGHVAEPHPRLGHADVGVHALHALGVEVDPRRRLDGHPFAQR